jgi:surfeit locus 1 family protein
MSANLTRTARQAGFIRGSSLLAATAVTLAVAIFLAAGFWQLHRAHYKDELKAHTELAMHDAMIELSSAPINAADLEFHPVHIVGEWVVDKTIFIDNKILDGVVGYQVVTPLRIGTSKMHVLVNRGWVAAPPLRSELPNVTTSTGQVEINGIARMPSGRFLELSQQVEQGRVWQNLTIERFQAWSNIPLQPTVVYQQNNSDDKLQRISVAPEASGLNADRHRGYALTWFGLALVTLVLGIAAKLTSTNSNDPKI